MSKPLGWLAALALAVSACRAPRFYATPRFYAHFVPYYWAGPAPTAECGQGPGFRYCINHAPEGVREDPDSVLYFMHFAGGSEKSWAKLPVSRVYYSEFDDRGLPAPRVLSISYGKYWNLFDKAGPKSPGLYASFVEQAMPWLEAKAGKPKRRFLWGMSQGSLNGAELVLRRPELWSGAAFSCPGWGSLSPYADAEQLADYVQRTGAELDRVQWWMKLLRERLAGTDEWSKESPMARAATAEKLPPIYIDANKADEFGFFEGASHMADVLKLRKQTVTFAPEPGGHCELDAPEVAAFLAGLAAQRRAR